MSLFPQENSLCAHVVMVLMLLESCTISPGSGKHYSGDGQLQPLDVTQMPAFPV